jgi:hypothetical protein
MEELMFVATTEALSLSKVVTKLHPIFRVR